MKNGKKILSVALALVMLFSVVPLSGTGNIDLFDVSFTADATSTGLSLTQLRQKFPHGKYWNHAGNPGSSNSVNNQNGYTSTPCSQHGVVGTSKQTCNGFQPSGTQLSWQCMGYAEKLGYDATGYNPRNNANGWYTYTSSSALDNLKPGDIVRYRNNGHSIYVTGVNGDTVTYTDCNSDGHCVIRWDATVSKATLRSSFTHVRSAPSAVSPGSTSCSCSTSYAGTYICTTSSLNLTIRSGHGSSYSAIGSIPPGAIVTVSKASGTSSSDWAHVTYNGVTGYASMQYLSKKQATQQRDSRMGLWLSDSEMGDSISTIRTGEWLYLCYKLYDANTGDLFDTYNTDGGYTAKMTLYEPNGAVANTCTYTNDNNWISIKRPTPGTYKGELVFTWDTGETATTTVSIDMVYEPRVTPSTSDIQLNVTGTNNQTISISYSGATSSNSIYLKCTTSGDCLSYKWGSWSDSKMPLTITGLRAGQGVITIKMYDSDTEQVIATSKVYVTVTAPTYTVAYNANGGSGEPNSQTKYYNTTLTLSSNKPVRTGYTFLGWSTSPTATSASYQSGSYFIMDADTTLYAVWKAINYTLSYNANNGSNAPSSQSGASSYTISSTVPTRNGYTFLGWSKSSSASSATYKPGETINLTANTTLYAVWKAASSINTATSYSLSIDFSNQEHYYCFTPSTTGSYTFESTGSLDTRVYVYNSSWTELGYNDDGGSGNNFKLTLDLTSGNKYYIKVRGYSTYKGSTSFEVTKNTYTLSYNANNGSNAPSSQSGASSYTISSTVPTRNGYTFLGWLKSSSASSAAYKPGDSINLTANTTLYAVWKATSSINTGTSYSLSIDFSNQEHYYSFTPSATGNYTFESTGSLDTRVYVYNSSWTELGYNDDGGSGNNFKLTLDLTSGNKYYIKVRGYGTKTGSTSFRVDKNITVSFYPNGGSCSTVSKTVYYGKTYGTLPTPTRTDYKFDGWHTFSGTHIKESTIVTDSSAHTLYAHWTYVGDYTLSYNANGGNGAPSSQSGGGEYDISSTVPTRRGYTFLGWSKSSTASSATYRPEDTITLTANTTLYAVWSGITVIDIEESYEMELDFGKQERYYTFTPDISGKYCLAIDGYFDVEVYVYNSSWTQLTSYVYQDDGESGSGFKNSHITKELYVDLVAGCKYYIKMTSENGTAYGLTFVVSLDEIAHTHSYTSTVTTQPTCTKQGVKTFKCSCGDTYTESIAVIAHDQKITVSAVAATCTQDGFTEGKRCSMCETTTVEQVKISATGHSDSDSDGYCDVCGYDLDPQAHCSCSCHKSGLAKFFFTIINFFQKLFGSNKVCSCGAKH